MDMDSTWERIKKGIKDGATMSMEKIEEGARIGKLKIDEMATRHKIGRNFSDIGERTYELLKDGKGSTVAEDLSVKKAAENIDNYKVELVDIQDKIKKIIEDSKRRGVIRDEEEITGI